MQSMTPSSQYLQALREGSHQPDDVQRDAVSRLDAIYQQLVARPEPQSSPAGGLRATFSKLLGKKEAPAAAPPVRGLYMLSLIHISEPTRHSAISRMPSSA